MYGQDSGMNKIGVLPAAAVTALQNGSKIEAIKHVREAHRIGLKEAKELVEHYLDANPDAKRRMSAANEESAKSFMGWVVLIMLAALAVYYFHFSGG